MKSIYKFLIEQDNHFQYTADEILSMVDVSSFDDVYPGYSYESDDEDNMDTMFYTKEHAYNFANIIIDRFTSLPNPIPIYRALKANSESDIDLEDPGIYWSMYKESAISFGSHNGSNFLLSAEIDKDFVDWKSSVKAYLEFSSGDDIDDENEITIADESQIKNIKITKLKWKNQ